MDTRPTFYQEISNMMYATHGDPISTCIQCGTCSGTCPVVEFMDNTPRDIDRHDSGRSQGRSARQQHLLVLRVVFPLQRALPRAH